MEVETSLVDNVTDTVVGGEVPLLPTVVALNTSGFKFVVVDPPEACDNDHYNQ